MAKNESNVSEKSRL